jgi:mannobiose 2-epimerase
VRHLVDPVHGGIYWSVDADGNVVDDRKQTYAQAFAVYALTEYARSRAGAAPLGLAFALIELIELHSSDVKFGGYFEARSRDWRPIEDVRLSPKDLNAPKSMNTLLHVMEAYTTVVEVTGDEMVRGRLAALTATILDDVVDLRTGSLRLFFDHGWTPLSSTVSYGHDIEGAWLLVAAARAVGDAALVERAEKVAVALADAVYREGRDEAGAVLYEYRPASPGVAAHTDRDSHWWAQAEGTVGFLDAYSITGDRRFLEAAAACWDVISTHHVDRVHGDWFKVLDPQRHPRPSPPKVGPWECPYHHVRACLEMIRRLPVVPARQEGLTS